MSCKEKLFIEKKEKVAFMQLFLFTFTFLDTFLHVWTVKLCIVATFSYF